MFQAIQRFLMTAALVLPLGTSVYAEEYLVGSGDTIGLQVLGEDFLTRNFYVNSACAVEFGLVGAVAVCGRSTDDIARSLSSLYADGYLVSPHVNVEVTKYGSQRVQVMGEVKNAGEIILDGPTTLLQAVLRAGDRRSENVVEVELVRGNSVEFFNLKELPSAAPVYVVNGDIVVLKQARFVYVTGGANNEGPVAYREGMTVSQALATAGGPGQYARLRQTYVKRADGSKIDINMKRVLGGRAADLKLEPDDQLVIPGS